MTLNVKWEDEPTERQQKTDEKSIIRELFERQALLKIGARFDWIIGELWKMTDDG